MARRQHRSHFHKTWTYETTPKPGFVYPIMFKECLPGDTWKITIGELLKTGAMLAPFFGRYQMRFAIFKEAYRNVWPNFDNARTGFAPNSNSPDTSVWPYMLMDATSCTVGSLADHLGVPALTFLTPDANGVLQPNSQVLKVAAAPFRVLAKIYNEWLMREHVQSELPLSLADGYDTTTNTQLFRIGWGHDRFTDALPDQQLGPQATLPIALEAPVVGTGKALGVTDGIGKCARNHKKAVGYLWGYDKDITIINGVPKLNYTYEDAIPTNWQKVYMFDKNKNFIKSYLSCSEAERDNDINRIYIARAARKKGKTTIHDIYFWRYEKDIQFDDNNKPIFIK